VAINARIQHQGSLGRDRFEIRNFATFFRGKVLPERPLDAFVEKKKNIAFKMTATDWWVMAVADVAKRTRLMWLGPKDEEAGTRKNMY